jgi:hypothetical protein
MPRVLPRPPRPPPNLQRVLALLASSRDGLTETVILKHGCTVKQINELLQGGMATASTQRILVGKRILEIARLRITEAGRQALKR